MYVLEQDKMLAACQHTQKMYYGANVSHATHVQPDRISLLHDPAYGYTALVVPKYKTKPVVEQNFSPPFTFPQTGSLIIGVFVIMKCGLFC